MKHVVPRPATHPARTGLGAAALVLVCTSLAAQDTAQAPAPPARLPFTVGERLVYTGKYGILKVGTSESVIQAIDTVRGQEVFRAHFTTSGGTLFISFSDATTTWFDTHTLATYRYTQRLRDPGYNRDRTWEIMPEKGIAVQNSKDPKDGKEHIDTSATVPVPLDDLSFIYFMRTVPLEVGKTYEYKNYFRADRNPVILKVLRRDTIDVPAGRFPCLVLEPVVPKAGGLFGEGGHALVWISDDPRRYVVQMTSGLKIGTLSLHLRAINP